MVAWRDAVNQALEQLVLAPPEGIESWEQVRALLPQSETFAWPEKAELPLDGLAPVHAGSTAPAARLRPCAIPPRTPPPIRSWSA